MSTQYYDLKDVTFIFGGIPIEGGKGEGGFLEIEPDEASFITVKGADGTVTRSSTGNTLYHISVFCSQKSRINTILMTFLATDQLASNGAGVVPAAIKDLKRARPLRLAARLGCRTAEGRIR